ncbi:MAG: aminotransferase class III-fold pyridoxal phosphate-dependent enzyme [Planctomycetota bacterium]
MTRPSPSTLAADQLASDPRVVQARALLAAALRDAQSSLAGVRPADPARAEQVETVYDQFAAVRGGALPLKYLGSGLGKGALVELLDGSVKYDLINGIGVHGLGHSDPGLLDAGITAALSDCVMQGNLQQNAESKDLCDDLVELANQHGARLNHCFLTTAGSMANENAIKIIFQKHAPATHLLAFARNFCGRTLAMSAITDKHLYRDGLPEAFQVHYLPFYKPADKQKSIDSALKHLHLHLRRYPGKIAGAMFEMVQGEGGYHPGDTDFFRALMAECRAHNVAVLVDEVQSFGRTSQPFAFQHYGLDELVDVVSVGKMSQVCATLFTDHYVPRPGLISQTFTGSTAQIFAAREVLARIRAEGWFGESGLNMTVRGWFASRFVDLHHKHPGLIARELYGLGAMIGFEVFGGDPEKTKAVMSRMYELGVIAFVCGANPLRLRFLPPVGHLNEADVDAVMAIVEQALLDVAAG